MTNALLVREAGHEYHGLRLRLSDFTYKELAQEMGDKDTDISKSGIQLCQYLDAADSKVERALEQSLAKDVKKRKRSETPEDIRARGESSEARGS
ncbi:hypothetical protein N7501_011211 [Penicillium viridicatum]|nr:hypothetical protein N7501_011211 [Penicillium viridicatum]